MISQSVGVVSKRALLTGGALSTVLATSGCGPLGGEKLLGVVPGEQGTFLAVGTDMSDADRERSSVHSSSNGDAPSNFGFSLLKSNTRGITIGAAVSGPASVAKSDADAKFIPASITKVVTAAVALRTLGPDFRFTTQVYWVGTNDASVITDLTVIADGDPTIDRRADLKKGLRPRLVEIAKELKARGVRRVIGDMSLISSDDRRDAAIPPEGIDDEDNDACYGAISQAFNYRENCPTGVPISDAKTWFGNVLISELKNAGIDVSKANPSKPKGEAAKIIAQRTKAASAGNSFVIQGPTVSEVLVLMNKPSNNFMADTLFKTVAVRHASQAADLRVAGGNAVKDHIAIWLRQAGHPEYMAEITLIDGAGLSKINRSSPRAFLTLLREFAKEPGFMHLWHSLPIAGRDGTLGGRMVGTKAAGIVRAKTGTLRGSYQLAGYVPRIKDGEITEYVPFVILSAATPENRVRVRNFQDQLVVKLMDAINPGRVTLARQ
jgi:D-alanyl-D-alanine carboxypeptidase/D-alanyl-D-alanine-endopeptidase (penicillin-binding protein 4)